MSEQKRLFLLDAYALIFRGYYALIKNRRVNSKGLDTSAIMGFINSLFDVIKKERPDHLAVAFDKGGSDLRSEMFSEYKSNRDETPEAIKIAVPYIQLILKAMHIPVVEKEGFEADDIIGTLAKQAEKEGYKIFMVTSDKDFAQLVSENIFIYRPARMGNGVEIWGVAEVAERFEVERPEQVIDYLGMMGDSVDNIPGLPGVGDKTAKKFIKTYGSMESLLENAQEIKGKLREKIETNKDLGMLSKKLATIITDVPVTFRAEDYELSKPNSGEVKKIFDELEFRRLSENFLKVFEIESSKPEAPTNSIEKRPQGYQYDLFQDPGGGTAEDSITRESLKTNRHFYQYVNTPKSRELLLKYLLRQESVCFDTETTSLNALKARLIGIAFSWYKGSGYYLVVPEKRETAMEILEMFRPFFESPIIEKIGHNLKYDLKVLRNYNIFVQKPFFDTMIAHYLINPDMRHNMDILAKTYLNYNTQSITELIGKKGKDQKSMEEVPLELQTEYAVEDADITFQFRDSFEKELIATNTLELYKTVELPLVEVLTSMECEGINLNIDFLKELSVGLTSDIQYLETSIFKQAGEIFNIASPKQLGIILYEKLKLVDKPKKTKTGQYSTAEDVLSYLAREHRIVSDILDWRSLQKLQNTYVDALPKEINSKTGRVHTIYNQAVAATGRLSSNNPNLQNIPIRTERGQQIRKAFVPRDEKHLIMSADYSQIELRIIAALSQDRGMMEAFKNNEDIHSSTAAKVFGVPLSAVTREQRSNAKTINFGIVYGVSAFGLSQQTDLNRTEAKALIEAYYANYPELSTYIRKQVDFARKHGYVETVLGRRRYLKNINSQNSVVRSAAERNAVNAPIQGSAADIIKLAMIKIHQRLRGENRKSKLLLQVHDELVFCVHKTELEPLKTMIKNEMENAFKLTVPLVVDIGVGKNWLEAH